MPLVPFDSLPPHMQHHLANVEPEPEPIMPPVGTVDALGLSAYVPLDDGAEFFAVVRYPSEINRVQRLLVGYNGSVRRRRLDGRYFMWGGRYLGAEVYIDYGKALGVANFRNIWRVKKANEYLDQTIPQLVKGQERIIKRCKAPTAVEIQSKGGLPTPHTHPIPPEVKKQLEESLERYAREVEGLVLSHGLGGSYDGNALRQQIDEARARFLGVNPPTHGVKPDFSRIADTVYEHPSHPRVDPHCDAHPDYDVGATVVSSFPPSNGRRLEGTVITNDGEHFEVEWAHKIGVTLHSLRSQAEFKERSCR